MHDHTRNAGGGNFTRVAVNCHIAKTLKGKMRLEDLWCTTLERVGVGLNRWLVELDGADPGDVGLIDRAIRGQHFGEGRYEQSERLLQHLLGVQRDLVAVHGRGVEAEADWVARRSLTTAVRDELPERIAS